LVSQQLTQSKLTHRDSRELNILPTKLFCVLWKNLAAEKCHPAVTVSNKSERKAQKIGIL
jgi:hypothetical protein